MNSEMTRLLILLTLGKSLKRMKCVIENWT